MRQYCAYCAFCIPTDCDQYYCTDHEECLSSRGINRMNKCENFALSDLGHVDTGRIYQPRKQKKNDGKQVVMELGGDDNPYQRL